MPGGEDFDLTLLLLTFVSSQRNGVGLKETHPRWRAPKWKKFYINLT
jgi:hypothetical protein